HWDVPEDHVFGYEIGWLAANGVTRGCNPPDNTRFCPEDPVGRGQMAAFLVRALGLTETDGTDFVDDDGSIFEREFEILAAAGIVRGCNPPDNDRVCPDDPVGRGQMAAFLVRALGLTETDGTDFVDDDGSIFEGGSEERRAGGNVRGRSPPDHDRVCPDDPVTRGQMAAVLGRALGLTETDGTDFVDDDGSIFEREFEILAAAGIVRGCTPPDNDRVCPDDPIARGQMAAFLVRALGLTETDGTDFVDDDGSIFEG